MEYKQVSISIAMSVLREIIIALLADEGYEGFEEKEDTLVAFISSDQFNERLLKETLMPHKLAYTIGDIAKVNWNKEWEENFEPVVVDHFCTIRAHFHDMAVHTPYEIVITPKMSFGTGHHATTQCMIAMMQEIDFEGNSVLDFGSGTGILAILASKLGAAKVVAIDNEEWAFENAIENTRRNQVTNVEVRLGSLEQKGDIQFDIVLANINRHILLQFMSELYRSLKPEGLILMSGLLAEEDHNVVLQAAVLAGFQYKSKSVRDKWLALMFVR